MRGGYEGANAAAPYDTRAQGGQPHNPDLEAYGSSASSDNICWRANSLFEGSKCDRPKCGRPKCDRSNEDRSNEDNSKWAGSNETITEIADHTSQRYSTRPFDYWDSTPTSYCSQHGKINSETSC